MKNQILMLCLFSMMSVACSQQWRDASGVTSEEMMAALAEVSGAQATATGGDLTAALAMKDQEGVRIYFAQSKNTMDAEKNFIDPMGPVASILSLTSFDFMGISGATYLQIKEARVFFFDVPSATGHSSGLIVGARKDGETAMTYAGFTGTATMSDAEMVVTLQSSGVDKVVLRSYDVESGDLASVIQLLVWDIDSAGQEILNGKFSTLIGFGD